ncbi:hypothetical protein FRC10_000890 [Ceratobasidium sp. 414]|nr:hypothetical protein FRC10_000890 [Ceratobasidium sp. 414]
MAPLDDAQNRTNLNEDPTYHEPFTPPALITTEPTFESDETMFSDSGSSCHTMSTLQSNEVAEYFRLVHGFTFPSDENVPLVFPTDPTAERIDIILHIIVRLCRDGLNVPPVVDGMLRTGGLDGGGAKVLDLVTNSGTWCATLPMIRPINNAARVSEMASTYATPKFISLDTKPLIPHPPHARINFQVYDFYAGIMEPDFSFDLTKNFNLLLQEVHRVLKPNGFLMITELPMQAYEEIDPPIPIRSLDSMARGTKLIHEACQAAGADITAWHDMSARLDPSHPLWCNGQPGMNASPRTDRELSGAQPVRGFHSIHLHSQPAPVGSWPEDEGQRMIGNLTRMWTYYQAKSMLPMILMLGIEEREATEFVDGLFHQLLDIDRHKLYIICRMWTARKI